MKKLLIGLLTLGSISSFASSNSCKELTEKITKYLKSEVAMDDISDSIEFEISNWRHESALLLKKKLTRKIQQDLFIYELENINDSGECIVGQLNRVLLKKVSESDQEVQARLIKYTLQEIPNYSSLASNSKESYEIIKRYYTLRSIIESI